MAKSKSKTAIVIEHDCERDAEGFGALSFVKCDRKHMGVDRPQISALKAELLAAGFESDEISLAEWLNDPNGGPAADEVAQRWLESVDVLGWDPREPESDWAMVAVLFVGDPAGENNDDAVAIMARPAVTMDEVSTKPWPFPKTDGGGPEVCSEPVLGHMVLSDGTPATIIANPAMTRTAATLDRKPGQFELPDEIDVLLKTFTPRTERHGEDKVSAASLGIKILAANTILDALSPTLRQTLYAAPEGQVTLPGVEESTPLLRTKVIETVKLGNLYEGWTLLIYQGIDDPLTISGCKVDKFIVTPHDGGSIELDFRIGSSDIDEHEAGWLYGHQQQDIVISLHAPLVRPDAIDGTQAAFDKDHPADERDAGDLFAEQHGHQSSGDDQACDEGAGAEDATEGVEA